VDIPASGHPDAGNVARTAPAMLLPATGPALTVEPGTDAIFGNAGGRCGAAVADGTNKVLATSITPQPAATRPTSLARAVFGGWSASNRSGRKAPFMA
jgi:hypothetical protein